MVKVCSKHMSVSISNTYMANYTIRSFWALNSTHIIIEARYLIVTFN